MNEEELNYFAVSPNSQIPVIFVLEVIVYVETERSTEQLLHFTISWSA